MIRCYNEERHIDRLLSGIVQQSLRDVEIVVVDSGSTDSTLAVVSRYPARVLRIRPEQFSFGRSLNMGCEAARGEIIVVVSAHVYPVYQDWLETLVGPFDDPNVALVYGKQRGNDVTKYAEHQVFAAWFPDEAHPDQKTPFCNNANAAIRRSVWQNLPYDEELTGLEDVDWAKRAIDLGMKIVYRPESEVIHVHEETLRQIFNRYRREAIAFKKIFPHETFTFIDFCRLMVTNVASDYLHAWHDGVLLANLGPIFTFRLMQFWGGFKGFSQHGPVSRTLKKKFYYPRSRTTGDSSPACERVVVDYSHLAPPGIVEVKARCESPSTSL